MITDNEIRIGNWVCYTVPDENSNVITLGREVFTKIDFDFLVVIHHNDISIDGIGLTPKILEGAGFGIGGDKVWSSSKYQIELTEEKDGYLVVINREYTDGTPKRYLHELQNVSFALYGEEIEIEL